MYESPLDEIYSLPSENCTIRTTEQRGKKQIIVVQIKIISDSWATQVAFFPFQMFRRLLRELIDEPVVLPIAVKNCCLIK